MEDAPVLVERRAGYRVITLNRPRQLNAFNEAMHQDLKRALAEAEEDSDCRALLLTGAGRAFCAGQDLRERMTPDGKTMVLGDALDTHYNPLVRKLRALPFPVVAAVNGVAMGGGFEIALSCDIIVAAENAVFALPEPRVGLIAGAGGVHRLPRIIPQKQALGMILTGRRVSAVEGKELGFVNEVVPPGQALSAAKRWAELILQCSPKAIRASKQSYFRGLEEPNLEAAMRKIYPAHQENKESLDYIEGPKAFAEKRKPDWQNK